jgi:hypothetical protein
MRVRRKGHLFNRLARFHVYDSSEKLLQMNDASADVRNPVRNPIFDLIIN